MTMKIAINVRGDKAIQRMFERVERRDGRLAIRRALRAGAEIVTRAIRARAPVGSKDKGDAQPGTLKKAVRTRSGKRSRRYIAMVALLGEQFFKNKGQFYGGPQEFGWKTGRGATKKMQRSRELAGMPARDKPRRQIEGRHFVEAAGESKERHAIAKVTRILTQELEKALH